MLKKNKYFEEVMMVSPEMYHELRTALDNYKRACQAKKEDDWPAAQKGGAKSTDSTHVEQLIGIPEFDDEDIEKERIKTTYARIVEMELKTGDHSVSRAYRQYENLRLILFKHIKKGIPLPVNYTVYTLIKKINTMREQYLDKLEGLIRVRPEKRPPPGGEHTWEPPKSPEEKAGHGDEWWDNEREAQVGKMVKDEKVKWRRVANLGIIGEDQIKQIENMSKNNEEQTRQAVEILTGDDEERKRRLYQNWANINWAVTKAKDSLAPLGSGEARKKQVEEMEKNEKELWDKVGNWRIIPEEQKKQLAELVKNNEEQAKQVGMLTEDQEEAVRSLYRLRDKTYWTGNRLKEILPLVSSRNREKKVEEETKEDNDWWTRQDKNQAEIMQWVYKKLGIEPPPDKRLQKGSGSKRRHPSTVRGGVRKKKRKTPRLRKAREWLTVR